MRLLLILSVALTLLLGWNPPVMALPSQDTFVQQVQVVENPNDLGELKKNQKLWEQQGIVNYRYTLTNSCFCIPDARGPVIIEVRDGTTTSVTSVSTGSPVNPEFFDKYDTVEKLFGVIKDAIVLPVDRIEVQYDPTFGYPTQINIDESEQIADEEVFLTIENLEVNEHPSY